MIFIKGEFGHSLKDAIIFIWFHWYKSSELNTLPYSLIQTFILAHALSF